MISGKFKTIFYVRNLNYNKININTQINQVVPHHPKKKKNGRHWFPGVSTIQNPCLLCHWLSILSLGEQRSRPIFQFLNTSKNILFRNIKLKIYVVDYKSKVF